MDDKLSLFRYRIEKAENDLQSAEILFSNNFYAQSLNRSYYSIFHSVRALFAFEGLDSKRHSGVIAIFNKEFVHKKLIPVEYYAILKTAERIRSDCDYDDFYIASKQQAEGQFENAKRFLNYIKEFISQNYFPN